MVVAIIAVPVRGMNREVDRDAIPLCEPGRELAHGLNALLMGELMRQRQNDVPAGCRAAPPSGFILGALGRVP